MKEENGKILLQPSVTNNNNHKHKTLQQNSTTNNMTNKHEQKDKYGHQQWPYYKNQPPFQNFKRATSPEKEEEKHLH